MLPLSLPFSLPPFPSKDPQLIYFLPSPSPHLGSHLYCNRWNMATQDFHVALIPMPRVFTCLWSHDSLVWQDTVNITWSYLHKGYRTTRSNFCLLLSERCLSIVILDPSPPSKFSQKLALFCGISHSGHIGYIAIQCYCTPSVVVCVINPDVWGPLHM